MQREVVMSTLPVVFLLSSVVVHITALFCKVTAVAALHGSVKVMSSVHNFFPQQYISELQMVVYNCVHHFYMASVLLYLIFMQCLL